MGISRRQLYSSRYRQLFRGVFQAASEPLSLPVWVQAAQLILPDDARPTGLTALQLAGLDLGQPLPLHFATASRSRCRRPDLRLHHRVDERIDASAALAEHCRDTAVLDAVVVADRCLHLGIISVGDVATLRHHPSSRVRAVAELTRPGAESPQETRTRLCLLWAGLPEPGLQLVLRSEGRFVGRYDMGYEDFGVLIDYEGDHHRTDAAQWSTDIVREEGAHRAGKALVRITARLMRDPWSQVRRVDRALREKGYRGPAPTPSAAWEAAFGNVRSEHRG